MAGVWSMHIRKMQQPLQQVRRLRQGVVVDVESAYQESLYDSGSSCGYWPCNTLTMGLLGWKPAGVNRMRAA